VNITGGPSLDELLAAFKSRSSVSFTTEGSDVVSVRVVGLSHEGPSGVLISAWAGERRYRIHYNYEAQLGSMEVSI
jgi:hypothetical protein